MTALKVAIDVGIGLIFITFFMNVLPIITQGFSFLISGFTYIPKVIYMDLFSNLPSYFKYGIYSLFCIIVCILALKIYSIFK